MSTAVPPVRRTGRILKGLAAAGLLGALAVALNGCGGGSRVDPFKPSRIAIFGDENSFMRSSDTASPTANAVAQPDGSSPSTPAGARYTINVSWASPPAETRTNPCDAPLSAAWFQLVAAHYGLVLEGCNYDGGATQGSTWATEGATAATIASSIDVYQAAHGPLRDGDLATVFAGTNDVLAAYLDHKNNGTALAVLRERLKSAGRLLSDKVADLADNKAHVLLVTTPDLGLSPYAAAELGSALVLDLTTTNRTDCERTTPANAQQWLSVLTDCFNLGLRSSPRLQGAGRRVALVRVDQDLRVAASNPVSYGFTNVTARACTAGHDVPACTISVTGTIGSVDATQSHLAERTAYATYLWADDYWLTPAGHARIAALALSQARTNWE